MYANHISAKLHIKAGVNQFAALAFNLHSTVKQSRRNDSNPRCTILIQVNLNIQTELTMTHSRADSIKTAIVRHIQDKITTSPERG
jgi:hypothetical protein